MSMVDVVVRFAQSGRIGPVRCGVEWSAVAEVMGPPWDTGTSVGGDGLPYLYAYGGLEIGTCHSICQEIQLVCLQTGALAVELPALGKAPAQTLPGYPTYSQIIAALEAADCQWEDFAPLTFDEQRTIRVTSSGVLLGFEIPDTGEPTLFIASVSARDHACGRTNHPAPA
ncbi:hypothetical protein [Streptomyces sp. NPDC018045]|uniref:hypothetical protein n=1 Tax=Streptomyces sp. NPDC018045 TaxID=3365037 RepID=UPI00378D6EC6